MALKTVSEFKDSIAALLSGIDLSNVDNLNGALERAARILVQKADVPEASGIQNITLYSGVYNYACATTIFGTAINDIRPQGVSRNPWEQTTKVGQEDFDRTKGFLPSGTRATFQYQNGVPIIRILSQIPQPQAVLDPMNAVGTSPNEWAVSGSASSLAQDNTVYYQSPSSLRFTLTGSSTGILTKTLQSTVDLETYEDVGVAFLAIRIPDGATASALTSIQLQLGSDSTNYDSVSDTDGFLGAWTAGDWLLVAFDFSGASSTGTPDWTALDYVKISFAHTATFTNFRVGGLWISLPSPAQILYQSAAIFKASGASATTTITTDNDEIILNDPAYNIYEYEGALSVLQQTGGVAGSAMMETFKAILHGSGQDVGLYAQFRGDNPSQELRMIGSYYDNGNGYGSDRNR